MSRFVATLVVCVITDGFFGVSFAETEKRGRLWYIRGSFGIADQNLSDLEKALKEEKKGLADNGVDVSTYSRNFDRVWDYRAEVGAVIWNRFSLGVLFDYQPRGDDQVVGGVPPGDQLRMTETIKINFLAFYGNLTYWLPGTHNFFFSGRGNTATAGSSGRSSLRIPATRNSPQR